MSEFHDGYKLGKREGRQETEAAVRAEREAADKRATDAYAHGTAAARARLVWLLSEEAMGGNPFAPGISAKAWMAGFRYARRLLEKDSPQAPVPPVGRALRPEPTAGRAPGDLRWVKCPCGNEHWCNLSSVASPESKPGEGFEAWHLVNCPVAVSARKCVPAPGSVSTCAGDYRWSGGGFVGPRFAGRTCREVWESERNPPVSSVTFTQTKDGLRDGVRVEREPTVGPECCETVPPWWCPVCKCTTEHSRACHRTAHHDPPAPTPSEESEPSVGPEVVAVANQIQRQSSWFVQAKMQIARWHLAEMAKLQEDRDKWKGMYENLSRHA